MSRTPFFWSIFNERQQRTSQTAASRSLMSLADVWRLERSELDRARKLMKRSSFNKRHRVVICEPEVERKIHAALAERLATYNHQYSHYSELKNVTLVQADADWLEQKMEEQFEKFDELCLATRIMLRILRRNEKRNEWNCAAYPRLVFRKRVELPIITPAVPRAYATSRRLLDWVESGIDPKLLFDASKPSLTPYSLSVAVCELAVRAGLTLEDRLLGCLRSLGDATPYCGRSNAVIIEYIADDRTDQHSNVDLEQGHDGEQVIRETIVLDGASAILAKAWKQAGLDTSKISADTLNDALRQVLPPEIMGRIGQKQQPLRILLAVAGLARRITQPGLRSAWEEGRLHSRTLNAERELALRTNTATPRQATLQYTGLTAAAPATKVPNAEVSADIGYIRWARRRLHKNIGKRRSRIAPNKLADAILTELPNWPGHTTTALVIEQFIREDLELATKNDTIQVSTVYGHVVAILEPLIEFLKNRDIAFLDSESLAAIAVAAIKSKRPNNQLRTFWVMRRFLRIVEKRGGAVVDEDEFDELDLGRPSLGPAYILTEAEYQRAREQTNLWARLAKMIGPQNSAYHPAEYESATEILKCSFRFGLRAGETESRRSSDFLDLGDSPVLLVRSHYRVRLKNRNSQRAVSIARCAGADEVEEFKNRVAVLSQHRDPSRADPELLAPPLKGPRIERVTELARFSLGWVADPKSARLHSGRKSLACSAAAQVLSADLMPMMGLQRPQWLEDIAHLDGAMQLVFTARLLGQGTPATTISYYVHLIGMMGNTDNGWPSLTPRGATVIGLCPSYGAFRLRMARMHERRLTSNAAERTVDTPHTQTAVADYVEALSLHDAAPAESTPPMENPLSHELPGNSPTLLHGPAFTLERLGEVVQSLIHATPLSLIEARFGLLPLQLQDLLDELLVLQEHHRVNYVTFDDQAQAADRGTLPPPIKQPVLEILRRCDALRADSPQRWREFSRVLSVQTKLDGALHLRDAEIAARTAATVAFLLDHPAICDQDPTTRRFVIRGGKIVTRGKARGFEVAPFRFVTVIATLSDRLERA